MEQYVIVEEGSLIGSLSFRLSVQEYGSIREFFYDIRDTVISKLAKAISTRLYIKFHLFFACEFVEEREVEHYDDYGEVVCVEWRQIPHLVWKHTEDEWLNVTSNIGSLYDKLIAEIIHHINSTVPDNSHLINIDKLTVFIQDLDDNLD